MRLSKHLALLSSLLLTATALPINEGTPADRSVSRSDTNKISDVQSQSPSLSARHLPPDSPLPTESHKDLVARMFKVPNLSGSGSKKTSSKKKVKVSWIEKYKDWTPLFQKLEFLGYNYTPLQDKTGGTFTSSESGSSTTNNGQTKSLEFALGGFGFKEDKSSSSIIPEAIIPGAVKSFSATRPPTDTELKTPKSQSDSAESADTQPSDTQPSDTQSQTSNSQSGSTDPTSSTSSTESNNRLVARAKEESPRANLDSKTQTQTPEETVKVHWKEENSSSAWHSYLQELTKLIQGWTYTIGTGTKTEGSFVGSDTDPNRSLKLALGAARFVLTGPKLTPYFYTKHGPNPKSPPPTAGRVTKGSPSYRSQKI